MYNIHVCKLSKWYKIGCPQAKSSSRCIRVSSTANMVLSGHVADKQLCHWAIATYHRQQEIIVQKTQKPMSVLWARSVCQLYIKPTPGWPCIAILLPQLFYLMVQKHSWLVIQGPFILWLMHSNFLLRDFCCQVACSEMYADDMLQLVFTVITALPLQSRLKPAIGRLVLLSRD